MDVPSAVLGLVLFEAAVGGLALLWAAPTWKKVRHGYDVLLGTTLTLMAMGGWAALRGPLSSAPSAVAGPAGLAATGLAITAAAAALAVVLVAVRAATPGRVAGLLAAAVGIATFVPLAELRAAVGQSSSTAVGFAELALGAFFLGAVWDGMVLGHWYLVERRLSNRYMVWIAWVNVAAVLAGLASVALSARNPAPCASLTGDDFIVCTLLYSPMLSIGALTIYLGIGMVALVALIAALNVKLAREGGRSIQASTGMFYLAVILAPAAEFAAKVRFF